VRISLASGQSAASRSALVRPASAGSAGPSGPVRGDMLMIPPIGGSPGPGPRPGAARTRSVQPPTLAAEEFVEGPADQLGDVQAGVPGQVP